MESNEEKPKRVVKTPWNRVVLDSDYEYNFGESLVEPDQSYTIREILERFSRGGAPDVSLGEGRYEVNTPYNEELKESDFMTSPLEEPGVDLADLDDIRDQAEAKMASAKAAYKKDKEKYAASKQPQKVEDQQTA